MLPELLLRIKAQNSGTGFGELDADLVRLEAHIRRVSTGALAGFGTVGKESLSTLALGVTGVLAPFLSLAAAIHGTRAALETFSDVADKSAAAGVDSEFFQGIAYNAKLAGVDIDTVASALDTFAKNAGLAAEGKGRMVSTLQALNPELLRNIELSKTQDERVRIVADALDGASSAAQRAAIATATFGDAGVKLAPIFAGGRSELEAMMLRAKEMGLIVDRDLIANADKYGDEWDTAAQIINIKVKSALVDLAPIMVDLVSKAADFAHYMGDQINGVKPMNIPSWGAGGAGTQMNQHLGDVLRGLAYPETSVDGLPRRYSQSEYGFGDMGQFFNGATRDAVAGLGSGSGKVPGASSPNMMGDAGLSLLGLNLPDAGMLSGSSKGIEQIGLSVLGLGDSISKIMPGLKVLGPAIKDSAETGLDSMLGAATGISGALSHLFQDNKAFAISNAVLQGLQGVSYALGSSAPPWNFINAAAVGVEAAANVSSILSTNIGTTSMPGSSGAPAAAAAGDASTGSAINLTIRGSGSINVDDFADQLAKSIADGGNQQLIRVIRQS